MTIDGPRVLMCPPSYFGVEYVINPWMEGNIGAAEPEVARHQWDRLNGILSERCSVSVIEPGARLPDMCFAANGGLVLDDVFLVAEFGVTQRVPEADLYRAWAESAGYETVTLPYAFEGEGDALWWPAPGPRPLLWAGYGVRSSLDSHRILADVLRVEVVSLRLVDERFYHLDTCFVPLPEGRVIYYPAAFDDRSQRLIESLVPEDRRIAVSDEDAKLFACNAIRVDHTLVTNHASKDLTQKLGTWGFDVITTPMDEFMKAGGAAKCLTLLLEQAVPADFQKRRRSASPIRSETVAMEGHLLDSGILTRAFDVVTLTGGSFRLEQFRAGERGDQHSIARFNISAPDQSHLDEILEQIQPFGVTATGEGESASLSDAPRDGVAPEHFYATTIYPTEVRIGDVWIPVAVQRMDAVIVVDGSRSPPVARCSLIRDLRAGDAVVCHVDGVRVTTPHVRHTQHQFEFMSAGVSSERRVEGVVEELAWEMRRIKARSGRIVLVAGPVVIHTGGARYLAELIRTGYVQALLTGNALPVHDIETDLYGTSLGVDLKRGVGVHGGHQHHLRTINQIRSTGSIREAVVQGQVTSGVMYECVRADIPYVLAGSIRDDGPLPETLMDLTEAQAAYSNIIQGADMILMLASMLHAIGTGNMTPAGVRLVCVDINPAVVTKLADRGSVESTGIVTDVGLFLNLLVRQLRDQDGP